MVRLQYHDNDQLPAEQPQRVLRVIYVLETILPAPDIRSINYRVTKEVVGLDGY